MPVEYRNLAYTSPSGSRIEFTYNGALSDGITHNLGEFQFAGTDEKYFQDRSISSDAFPFVILLNNQDTLREVRALLNEKVTQGNPGILEHPDPTMGSFPAVCASYKVDQNSVNRIGIIRVSVIFFRQIPSLIGGDPSESNNPASAAATLKTIDILNSDQATDLETSVNQSTGRGTAALVETTTSITQDAIDILGGMAAKVDEINILFSNKAAEILSTADELARAPFTLARQVQTLIQLPFLAVEGATERISTYFEYIQKVLILNESESIEVTEGSPAGINLVSVRGMAALAAVSSINYSAVSTESVSVDQIKSGEEITETGYLSRRQIIETIQSVQNSALFTTEFLSELAANFGASTFFTQYFDYSILNKNLITATIRNLNARIFSTSQEVIFTTTFEENIVPLCGRLYGSVQVNTVKFLQESNKLHGDDIYLVPKNKEILFYE